MKTHSKTAEILLGFCVVALIITRAPNLFLQPRFWAEEGEVYFAFALHHPWPQALFAPHQGYFSLGINFATLLAARFPLQYAPFFTTFYSFFVQMVPFLIILSGTSIFWNTWKKKALSCALVLFAPSLTGELWLNSTNSGHHLCAAVFLVFLEPVIFSALKQRLLLIFLFFAGLSSPTAVMLAPLFFLKAKQEKQTKRFQQASVLMFCFLIQSLVFFVQGGVRPLGEMKSFDFMESLLSLAVYAGVTPFWGLWGAAVIMINPQVWYGRLLLILTVTGLGFFSWAVAKDKNKVGLYGLFLSLGFYGLLLPLSIYSKGGIRYAYVPNIMLVFWIYSVCLNAAGKTLKRNAARLLALSLLLGVAQYKSNMDLFNLPSWPQWKDEVAHSQNRHLKIWPQETPGVRAFDGHHWKILL